MEAYQIFQDIIKETSLGTDVFNVASLPEIVNHKIGASDDKVPMFFIKCDGVEATNYLGYNLELISIQFDKDCSLISDKNNESRGKYTVICFKSHSAELQRYFIEIVYLLLKRLPSIPKADELRIEIEKVVILFSKLSKSPIKTAQGIWSELLVIEQSKDPDYLVRSWHISSTDKYDFNDGTDKIEVKSTLKSQRVHHFSLAQLTSNPNSKLLIGSIMTVETGIGKSISDLINQIEKRLKDKNLVSKLNEMLAQTLGCDLEKAFDLSFDYQMALDSLEFYDAKNIPSINNESVPSEISNIHFDCNLTEIKPLSESIQDSPLQKATF